MASSSSKRPAVWSKAERGCPTGYERYEITLPFYDTLPYYSCDACSYRKSGMSRTFVPCANVISFVKVKEKALWQTEKRWAWFSDAQKLDDKLGRRLGTLGYLPLEIREMIWHAVIEKCMGTSTEIDCHAGLWGGPKYIHKWNNDPWYMDLTPDFILPDFILQPHDEEGEYPPDFYSRSLFHRSPTNYGLLNLREASPDINIELENNLISDFPFRFNCPVVLMHYLNTTPARQLNHLRSVIVELSGCDEDCCYKHVPVPWRSWSKSCGERWSAAIEHLPAAIKLINFELGWKPMHVGDGGYVNEMLAQLEIVGKKTQRLAPNAEITMTPLIFPSVCWTGDWVPLTGVRDPGALDPKSHDIKKWWREFREETKSEREEAWREFSEKTKSDLKVVGAGKW